jgi:hypothetical protein|tara:strand:- start:177 stop:356 length:180 start_codon:yes stop_codon:yes gene_type:complete
MKKMNKEEFIEKCRNDPNLNWRDLLNDEKIIWNESKKRIAILLDTPHDYFLAIEDYNNA